MAKVQADLIWFNGEMVPWQDATVHVMSHALHYGSSVFEGIRVYDTPNGLAFFRLQDHVRRLFESAKIYRFAIPFSQQQIIDACKQAVIENNLNAAYLRPLAFLGDVGMGLRPPSDAQADVMIAAFEWQAYLGDKVKSEGVNVGVSSWNRLAPNTMPTAAKAGGNYLSSRLISSEAIRHGYDEGIALDVNNYVSEGAGQNLFLVRDGVIYTPPSATSILQGITRDSVFALAQSLGYEVKEETLSRESLYLCDEFFMTGTATEIVPVRSVDQLPVGDGSPGPITLALQNAFFGIFTGETKDNWQWLTPVAL